MISLGNLHRSRGFTLIEALIAFLVLSVGILGALMFHSTLLKESGDSKARIEAVKLAEKLVEEQRQVQYQSRASLAAAMGALVSAPIYSIVGTNETFFVDWSNGNLVSGSTDVYQQDVTLSWGSGSLVSLTTFYSWFDLNKTIDPVDAASGTGGDYQGSIPLPTGTLTAVERLKTVDIASLADANAVSDDGQLYTYRDPESGEDLVAIKLADDTYVQLAKLSDPNNEIFTISGQIYNLDAPNRLSEVFNDVYEIQNDLGETTTYYYDIIDVRASGGANCIVTEFSNVISDSWAKYVCVAGTGWNGYIYPYLRVENPKTVSDYDLELLTSGNLVCAPRQRSYRYYTIALQDSSASSGVTPEIFADQWVDLIGVSQSATSILESVSGALVGQSGLVRFYLDQGAVDLAPSGEGIAWSEYFWQNPNYIVSPGWASTDDNVEYRILNTSANQGYKVPPFVSGARYSTNYPGDIAYQNFYLANTADKDSTVADCDQVLAQAKIEFYDPNDPLSSSFLLKYGTNGYRTASTALTSGVEYGYIPSGAQAAGNNYSATDFNFYDWDEIVKTTGKKTSTEYIEATRGSSILGYVLATETVQGRIGISSTLEAIGIKMSDFTVVGNPEPTASIVCSKASDDSGSTGGDGYTYYDYSCPVPKGWTGRIVAHHSSDLSQAFACNSYSDSDINLLPYWNSDLVLFSTTEGGDTLINYYDDGLREELGYYALEEFLDGSITTSAAYESFVSRDVQSLSSYIRIGFMEVETAVFSATLVSDLKFDVAKCNN